MNAIPHHTTIYTYHLIANGNANERRRKNQEIETETQRQQPKYWRKDIRTGISYTAVYVYAARGQMRMQNADS